MSAPTEQRPNYYKVRERIGSNLFMVMCDEGWRVSVLATGMWERVADWIIASVQGQPMPHIPERETLDLQLRKMTG